MAYRVKHTLSIIASLDEDEKLIGFERTNSTVTQVTRTDPETGLAATVRVDASSGPESLPFGDVVSGQVFYLETDVEVTLTLNGAGVGITISPQAGNKAKFFCEGAISSATVTNATSSDATISYMIAGALT